MLFRSGADANAEKAAAEAAAEALGTGVTEITGLTNGKTYTVTEVVVTP